MTDLNWNAVFSFWLVAQHGSFAAAARTLPRGSAQALHKRIRELEKPQNLNLKLLRSRGMKGVALTEAGRRIFELVDPVFKSLGSLTADLRKEDAGPLNVAITGFVSHHYAVKLLQRFHHEFPDVSVRVRVHSSDEVLSLAESGEVDFGIGSPPRGHHHLTVSAPVPIRCEILVPRNHPLCRRPFTWSELVEYPLVVTGREGLLRKTLDQFLAQNHIASRLDIRAEVTTSELAVEAVRSGLGVGFVPVGPRLAKRLQGLARLRPPAGFPTLNLAVVYRSNRYLPGYMRGFLRIASDVMGSQSAPEVQDQQEPTQVHLIAKSRVAS